MRKMLLAPLFALLLGGCQTNLPPTSPVVNAVVGVLPQHVQDIAVQACGYLPTAQTVASLIEAFGGPAIPGLATQIANEICATVVRPQARRAGVVRLRGVAVRGRFVR